jgi:LuxR family maltose regulon positive regulatory protein
MAIRERRTGPGYLLQRPRLLEALDGAFDSLLALVIAPAGFGKSELLTQWLQQHPDRQSVHLSLDERDNDVGRF